MSRAISIFQLSREAMPPERHPQSHKGIGNHTSAQRSQKISLHLRRASIQRQTLTRRNIKHNLARRSYVSHSITRVRCVGEQSISRAQAQAITQEEEDSWSCIRSFRPCCGTSLLSCSRRAGQGFLCSRPTTSASSRRAQLLYAIIGRCARCAQERFPQSTSTSRISS